MHLQTAQALAHVLTLVYMGKCGGLLCQDP